VAALHRDDVCHADPTNVATRVPLSSLTWTRTTHQGSHPLPSTSRPAPATISSRNLMIMQEM